MMNILIIGVKMVNHHIGVTRMAGSEDNDLKILGKINQDLPSIGTNIDTSFY